MEANRALSVELGRQALGRARVDTQKLSVPGIRFPRHGLELEPRRGVRYLARPEYAHSLETAGDREKAEAELAAREKRVERLKLVEPYLLLKRRGLRPVRHATAPSTDNRNTVES
jgi:hypothetical protein